MLVKTHHVCGWPLVTLEKQKKCFSKVIQDFLTLDECLETRPRHASAERERRAQIAIPLQTRERKAAIEGALKKAWNMQHGTILAISVEMDGYLEISPLNKGKVFCEAELSKGPKLRSRAVAEEFELDQKKEKSGLIIERMMIPNPFQPYDPLVNDTDSVSITIVGVDTDGTLIDRAIAHFDFHLKQLIRCEIRKGDGTLIADDGKVWQLLLKRCF